MKPEGPGAVRREAPPASGLPCQYGHKSNSLIDRGRQESTPELTASCAKTVFCLAREAALLARDHPVDRIGFLTLTFAENLVDRKEAWRRFRSLRSRVLSTRFVCCIAVSERQFRGAWHFHLIVVTKSFLGTASDAGWAKQAQMWWQCGHRKEACGCVLRTSVNPCEMSGPSGVRSLPGMDLVGVRFCRSCLTLRLSASIAVSMLSQI